MKFRTLAASTAALAIAFSGAPILAAGSNPDANASANVTSLLDQANQMNHEEIDAADMALHKAGDNIAFKAMANTLKEDHEVNQTAVKALADKENVNLSDYHEPAADKHMSNLKGMPFADAFLQNQVQDHRAAIQKLENARNNVTSPALKMYIDETIPVLQAHMKVAQNLQRDMQNMNNEQTSER